MDRTFKSIIEGSRGRVLFLLSLLFTPSLCPRFRFLLLFALFYHCCCGELFHMGMHQIGGRLCLSVIWKARSTHDCSESVGPPTVTLLAATFNVPGEYSPLQHEKKINATVTATYYTLRNFTDAMTNMIHNTGNNGDKKRSLEPCTKQEARPLWKKATPCRHTYTRTAGTSPQSDGHCTEYRNVTGVTQSVLCVWKS